MFVFEILSLALGVAALVLVAFWIWLTNKRSKEESAALLAAAKDPNTRVVVHT